MKKILRHIRPELVILESCGYLPQEECLQAFLTAVENFMTQLEENK